MDYKEIYRNYAPEYDRLVSAEDADGQLLPALQQLAILDGASVLEVGAGTGRISRLLLRSGRVARLMGVDLSAGMLTVARDHLLALRAPSLLAQADACRLPVRDQWADMAIAGWVFGHFRAWMADRWQMRVIQALEEMKRVLKPNGTFVIIETLGTGATEAMPPDPKLAEYYRWIETVHGFKRVEIRTDYQFTDIEQAAVTTGFFFGEAFGEKVRTEGWARVPEYTGIWWKRK